MKYVATTGGREILVEIVDEHHIIVDGVSYEIDFESVSEQTVYSLLANNKSHDALPLQELSDDFRVQRSPRRGAGSSRKSSRLVLSRVSAVSRETGS